MTHLALYYPPIGSYPPSIPGPVKIPAPFEGVTSDYVLSALKKIFQSPHAPRDWTYQTSNWTLMSSASKAEAKSPLAPEVLALFTDTDVKIVADDKIERSSKEITEQEARACHRLYEAISNGSTSIHLDPEFQEELLQCIRILLTRPSGRQILFTAASLAIPVHICEGKRSSFIISPSLYRFNIEIARHVATHFLVHSSSGPVLKERDMFISLAHELIHAIHYSLKDRIAPLPGEEFALPPGFMDFEEFFTIAGVPGTGVLCENKLRAEFELPIRISHEVSHFPPFSEAYAETVHSEKKLGFTWMENAVRLGLFTEVQKLIAFGADPNEGLFYALLTENIEILDYLLSHGADPNSVFSKDMCLLHFAVAVNCKKAVACLLTHGADINKRNCKGLTPLHIAIKKRIYNQAILLLDAGANPDIKCKKSRTALETATKKLDEYSVKLLLQHNAKITKNTGKYCKKAKELAQKSLSATRRFFAVKLEYTNHLKKQARSAAERF